MQKEVFLFTLMLGLVLLGSKHCPKPVLILFLLYALSLINASLPWGYHPNGWLAVFIRGTAGAVLPWLLFFIDWRAVGRRNKALALCVVPLVTIAFNALLSLMGQAELWVAEYTGALRLSAGMPPAYLAGLCFFGALGAMWLWLDGFKAGLWLGLIDLAVCVATGTRGATGVAGLAFLICLVIVILRKSPGWKSALLAGIVGFATTIVAGLPLLLERTSNSVYGTFSFSGRIPAWKYFISRIWERPLLGYGPGSEQLVSAESGNRSIVANFVSPHNIYINAFVNHGLILGAAVLIAWVAIVVAIAGRVSGDSKFILILGGCAAALYGGFDNIFNVAQSAILFVLFLVFIAEERPQKHVALVGVDESYMGLLRLWLTRFLMPPV